MQRSKTLERGVLSNLDLAQGPRCMVNGPSPPIMMIQSIRGPMSHIGAFENAPRVHLCLGVYLAIIG